MKTRLFHGERLVRLCNAEMRVRNYVARGVLLPDAVAFDALRAITRRLEEDAIGVVPLNATRAVREAAAKLLGGSLRAA